MQTQTINELVVNNVVYVRKDSVTTNASPPISTDGAVIVRSEIAGCFFGTLTKSDLAHGVVELRNARRLWYWTGAASLSQLAVDGTSKPRECKFPVAVPEIHIAKVVEVIPCTVAAVTSIAGVPVWKA